MLLSEALSASNKVEGWLSLNEQRLLYTLAKEVPRGKAIVELGAWKGKATIMLAAGSMAGSKVPVYAVDYFTPTSSVGHDYALYLQDGAKDYLSTFLENIHNAGLSSIVTPIRNSTMKAAQLWTGPPPHFLFIDADHRYHAVQSDFLAWIGHCSLDAQVAFHDFNAPDYPGVGIFVNRLLVTRIISHAGIVDSIGHGELAITDVARVKRRLELCPYFVAWFLSIIQRISRIALCTPVKILDVKNWERMISKCLRQGP